MVMKLVRKKNTRGDLIRWLTHEEDTAVKNISGLRDLTSRPQHSLATQVLREMRQLDAWLQCGCVPGDPPAMNSAKLSKDTGKLYLSGFNHEHAADCPMYRPFSADGGATSSGSRQRAGSRRINYRKKGNRNINTVVIKIKIHRAPLRPSTIGANSSSPV